MPDLPQGTVTLLFTDIEGSTLLLQRLGESYAQVLSEHHLLLRAIFEKWGGHEVDTQGDAFFVVFSRATDALNMTIEAQETLATHDWPEAASVRVRMALHTGEPKISASEYIGIDVHRAARLCSAGHGGQVLISQTTYDLIKDQLPVGASLRDMGVHRLKDLQQPEPIFQLVISGLPDDFPPLKTLDIHKNNLPTQPTPLIGRDKDLTAARQILLRKEVRIVTLTGAGGSGKTRLAIQIAAELIEDFSDGVYFCPLASIRDPGLVILTIAQIVGVKQTVGFSIMEELKSAVLDKWILLVLDNFEQVTDAAPLVAELISSCSQIKVLVTSREKLRLRGEYEFPVQPLPLPDLKHLPRLDVLAHYPAVELFIQRAIAVKPDFALTEDNAPVIAEICARVDGLPLAIELAAARIKLLPPQALLSRLGHRLTLLTGGARDLPTRQQTLRNTIDWSYELLNEREQTLFKRMAIFVGGCSLEAAEAVCGGHGLEIFEILEVIASLVDKSLVRQESSGDEPRFEQLEMLREYGLEQLDEDGETKEIRRSHASYFLALAELADPLLESPEQALWVDRLDHEYGNMRAALEWLIDDGELDQGLRLGVALWRFWEIRGYLTEGRVWLDQLLSLSKSSFQMKSRSKALYAAGVLADAQCDYTTARNLFEEYLAINREVGEPLSLAAALNNLGNVANAQEDFQMAESCYTEALEIFRKVGEEPGQAWSLQSLANIAQRQNDFAKALSLYEEVLEIWKKAGYKAPIAVGLIDVGGVLNAMGDYDGARSAYEQSLAIFREQHNGGAAAISLNHLGNLNYTLGDYAAARTFYELGLKIVHELGDMRGIARLIESLASLAAAQAQPERALRLAGAAAELRRAIGAPLPSIELARFQNTLDLAKNLLSQSPADADALFMAGQRMSPEEIIEYALEKEGETL